MLIKINNEKCTLCMLCVECCPAYVFVIENGSIKANGSKCIECYGCIPLCPVQAITIEILEGTLIDFIGESSSEKTKSQKFTNLDVSH